MAAGVTDLPPCAAAYAAITGHCPRCGRPVDAPPYSTPGLCDACRSLEPPPIELKPWQQVFIEAVLSGKQVAVCVPHFGGQGEVARYLRELLGP